MVKNVYCGNDGFIFAWDLGSSFLGVPNWVIGEFSKKNFLNFGLKEVMEKCVGCFLVYLFFGGVLFKNEGLHDTL